ncbi:type 1 glutamine amidotransferase domain-containing protein [Actinomadura rayongensis]|uniref:DJ-1/PfpI/YhbO family deglycase/protease n=1 Tax=Actinomadura rayongensis TaxID=1429076 RepID=A0A6I4W3U4_9ACTN|nr:type 1 glutamine amidotransferase domain-containing protein [Actinomadura rayongensis]MXQ64113.1 DJ-1/PfpI/YhbO family deglycase/protease [Actinomadura rayongensis]
MAHDLKGKTIAVLAAPEGTEQVELTEPRDGLREAGADVRLISTTDTEIQMFNHLDKGDTLAVDAPLSASVPDAFDALVLPGGVANPDFLRTVPEAVAFVRAFFDAGKPVAAICHAPWLLAEADVVNGRTLTSWPSLRTDLTNAGALWRDEEVQVCEAGPNTLVTSRKPDDLPAFVKTAVDVFAA